MLVILFDANKVITEYLKDIIVVLSSVNQAERRVPPPPPTLPTLAKPRLIPKEPSPGKKQTDQVQEQKYERRRRRKTLMRSKRDQEFQNDKKFKTSLL